MNATKGMKTTPKPEPAKGQAKQSKISAFFSPKATTPAGGMHYDAYQLQHAKPCAASPPILLKSTRADAQPKAVTPAPPAAAAAAAQPATTPQQPATTPVAQQDQQKQLGAEAVGRRVRVFWPLDKAWYKGTIKQFDGKGKHQGGDRASIMLSKPMCAASSTGLSFSGSCRVPTAALPSSRPSCTACTAGAPTLGAHARAHARSEPTQHTYSM